MKYCTTITETHEGFKTEVDFVSSGMRSGALVTDFGYRKWTVHKTLALALEKERKETVNYANRHRKEK